MALTIIAFAAFFVLITSCGLLLVYRDVTMKRLATIVSQRLTVSGNPIARLMQLGTRSTVETIITPFQNIVPRSPQDASVIQKRLMRAGYREDGHLNIFYASKVLVPLSLILLATTMVRAYPDIGVLSYALAAGLGFLLPDFWLGRRIAKRKLKLRLGLPDALDLMVVCIGAGLGVDQAILRTSVEFRLSLPELSDEFGLVMLEQRAGRPRDEAWKNLAERTDVSSVRALVAPLVQADHFGTSISKSLRSYADSLRTLRRQQIEEAAAKTTVKLVFPLVLFIFPSIFVVTAGPAMITIMEFFEKGFAN
jgi:tight adherence protein C